MASPEAMESCGTLDSSFLDELSAPKGWTKKLLQRKSGTPKRKDVFYVAPTGEEIRNKRQLEKYLKVTPGGLSSADFDWSTGEIPKRSARLSSRGRASSDTEGGPTPKRSKTDVDKEAKVISPRKTPRRKSAPQATVAEKDEVMTDTEKADGTGEVDDNSSAPEDKLEAAEPVEEKVAPTVNDTGEKDIREENAEQEVAVAIGDVKIGESAEHDAPPTEEPTSIDTSADKVNADEQLTSVETSADKVNAEEQPAKTEEIISVVHHVVEEATVVDEAIVTVELLETSTEEVTAMDEVVHPPEGETSLTELQEVKGVDNNDVFEVPTTERLDRKDDDPFVSKEHIESQGLHALVKEPILSGGH